MSERTNRRVGLTLVELLVVIAIIAALATLTALYFPRFQEGENVNRGADLLGQWLLIAKQQARRDGRPTGIRFSFATAPGWPMGVTTGSSTNLPTGTPIVSEIVLIQQQSDAAQGWYTGRKGSTPPDDRIAQFQLPTNVTFGDPNGSPPAAIPVADGDYLELFGSGVLRRITTIPPATRPWDNGDPTASPPRPPSLSLSLDPNDPALDATKPDLPPPAYPSPPVAGSVTNYRIIPQPRDIPGEQPLKLPDGVGVLGNSISPGAGTLTAGSLNVPGNNQILFSPSGAVVGTGTGNAQIIFWVNHLHPQINKKVLVTVQPRTGFIASHPVMLHGSTTISGGQVQSVTVTNGGSGYTSPPPVYFIGGGGSGATGTATISSGSVTSVTVTNGGSGYLSPPEVSFDPYEFTRDARGSGM